MSTADYRKIDSLKNMSDPQEDQVHLFKDSTNSRKLDDFANQVVVFDTGDVARSFVACKPSGIAARSSD